MLTSRVLAVALFLVASELAAAEAAPSAEQLYARVRETRLALAEKGPAATLDFFSRKWLEDGLASAFRATDRTRGPVDYVSDSLWASFSVVGSIVAVYSYRTVPSAEAVVALEMQTTSQRCESGPEQPSTDVYTFVFENGAWRLSKARFNSTARANTWFRSPSVPVERFPKFRGLDRTLVWREYFHDSGMDVKDPCAGDSKH